MKGTRSKPQASSRYASANRLFSIVLQYLALVAFVGLIAGCATPASPSIAWDFDVRLDNRDQPHGKVWVLVNHRRYLITSEPIAGYRIVAPSDYQKDQVPADALSACSAWWAGLGEDMYVRVVADRVEVFRRNYGEISPTIPAYSLFMSIPVSLESKPAGVKSRT